MQFGFSGVEGRIHSANFVIADEENAYFRTAQIVVETVEEILRHPEFQVKNPDFAQKKSFYLKKWLGQEEDV